MKRHGRREVPLVIDLKKWALRHPGLLASYLAFMRRANAGRRRANVAMFHDGRCGSSVLGHLLNQHPQIKWSGEIFAQINKKYDGIDWVRETPMRLVELRMYGGLYPVYGFETKRRHLGDAYVGRALDAYVDDLVRLGFDRFVVLKRKHYLRQRVSALVGRKTGVLHASLHSGQAASAAVRVRLDPEDLLGKPDQPVRLVEYFEELDAFYEGLGRLLAGRRCLWITYEDDIDGHPQQAYEKMCRFLGLPVHPVDVAYRKTNPFRLDELIENVEEVRAALEGTPYAWMLDDDASPR